MLHSAAILIVTKFGPSIFPLSFWFIEQRIAAVARKSMQDIMLHTMSISLGIIWTEMRFTEFRHFLHRVQSSSLHDRYWKMSRPLHVKELCLAFQEFNPLWYIQLCFNIYGFNLLCDALWCFFYHRTHSHTHTNWNDLNGGLSAFDKANVNDIIRCFFSSSSMHCMMMPPNQVPFAEEWRERKTPSRCGIILVHCMTWWYSSYHRCKWCHTCALKLSSAPTDKFKYDDYYYSPLIINFNILNWLRKMCSTNCTIKNCYIYMYRVSFKLKIAYVASALKLSASKSLVYQVPNA